MKRPVLSVFLLGIIVFTCTSFINLIKEPSSRGFAIIELFTSEGCSSCPPAESLMDKLIQRNDSLSIPVYIVEYHVDYWDYLGWKDTLANHEYSQRQQKYSDQFKLNSIYTPQAIVNGENEMVGSNGEKIDAAIGHELQKAASVAIDCSALKTAESNLEVKYKITGDFLGSELNFIIVESALTTYVKKGENAHKTLAHDNVARVFKSVRLNSAAGSAVIEAIHVNLAHCRLICFTQNMKDLSITGAIQVKSFQ